jgi:riboflavin synthase
MFSWIIEHKAKILARDGWKFVVEKTFEEALVVGQSIAHDGACMTITNWNNETYEFFVMEESLRVTNYWMKKIWDFFNIEQSLKLGDRIDGHMVTGHIDTTWVVRNTEKKGDGSLILSVSFDTKYQTNIIQKGSITINWVSLTIMETGGDFLSVSLIPLTQNWTNLWLLKDWDIVNLEFDMVGKYVAKILQK